MIYKVIEKSTELEANVAVFGKTSFPKDTYIVNPSGKVCWWDESQGWEPDEDQDRWEIILLEYKRWKD